MFSFKFARHLAETLHRPSFIVSISIQRLSQRLFSKRKKSRMGDEQPNWVNVGKYSIFPWSISGIETCIVVKTNDLHVSFDMGYSCKESVASKYVFVSHGHMDHISGVPQHATKRSLYGMKPAIYYTPEHLVNSLASVCEGYAKMAENVPVLEQMDIRPAKLGESIHLPSNYIVKPFPTVHRVASQGYIIYEHTKKLKPEFQGLPSHVIAQKVREGQEINDVQEIPSIAYTGDTTFEVFLNPPTDDLLKVKLLITETTYIDEEQGKNMMQKARDRGHIHLQELAYYAYLFENVEKILLIHFSDKYSPNYIEHTVRQKLPDSLVDKVHVATVAKEKYG